MSFEERSTSSPSIPRLAFPPTVSEFDDVRRVLLAGTQHYLYYRLNKTSARIEVLAVWSTSRGDLPHL